MTPRNHVTQSDRNFRYGNGPFQGTDCRITDYTTDDRTGNIVSGSNTRELFMVYDWKMMRQKDKKTLNQPSVTQISCPNCGAPLDINHSGKCPYCGTVVTVKDHDWALSVIKGISQRTVGN